MIELSRLGFRCEVHSDPGCDPYACIKYRSGLLQGGGPYRPPSGVSLTERERWLVGWLPLAGSPSRLMAMLAGDEERAAEDEARLRGLRYLLDLGDEERE